MKTITPALEAYIQTEILTRYAAFDKAHRRDHAQQVIDQSLILAEGYEVETDMVYTIAAYHDVGLGAGRERHHITSGEMIIADERLRTWFTEEQLVTMRDAVEDHRASLDHKPRTLYGCIVAEADRCLDPQTVIRRTIQYGKEHYPNLGQQGSYRRCLNHLRKKYADGGYLKLWIPESDNNRSLEELRAIIHDERRLHAIFTEIYTQE